MPRSKSEQTTSTNNKQTIKVICSDSTADLSQVRPSRTLFSCSRLFSSASHSSFQTPTILRLALLHPTRSFLRLPSQVQRRQLKRKSRQKQTKNKRSHAPRSLHTWWLRSEDSLVCRLTLLSSHSRARACTFFLLFFEMFDEKQRTTLIHSYSIKPSFYPTSGLQAGLHQARSCAKKVAHDSTSLASSFGR